jgi:glucuronosyltransferase
MTGLMPKSITYVRDFPCSQLCFIGHPNVRAFITHGGLMGTMEAVFSGVPMVAIPLFGDQFHNVKNFEDEGIAVKLDHMTITKEKVLRALREVLDNPR